MPAHGRSVTVRMCPAICAAVSGVLDFTQAVDMRVHGSQFFNHLRLLMIEFRLIGRSMASERREKIQNICADSTESSSGDRRSRGPGIRVEERNGRRRLVAVGAEPVIEHAKQRSVIGCARADSRNKRVCDQDARAAAGPDVT